MARVRQLKSLVTQLMEEVITYKLFLPVIGDIVLQPTQILAENLANSDLTRILWPPLSYTNVEDISGLLTTFDYCAVFRKLESIERNSMFT